MKEAPSTQQESDHVESDTESIEMPKSHSVPNMTWREAGDRDAMGSDDSLFEDDDSDNKSA